MTARDFADLRTQPGTARSDPSAGSGVTRRFARCDWALARREVTEARFERPRPAQPKIAEARDPSLSLMDGPALALAALMTRNRLESIPWVTLGVALLMFAPGIAYAYTVSNTLLQGCHEGISAQALRNVREVLATAAPLPADENDQALIDDVEFTPDPDMRDLGGTTFLLGVRDNDLQGQGGDDLSVLEVVASDPTTQDEHCLRAADQDEPGGTQAAIASCRAFILSSVTEALAGLDPNGMPDPTVRTDLTVTLALRGQVTAPLPTYYVRMGQAIHAVEDSFTHTYRTADEMQITVALNWIDQVNGTLDESRDGPAHSRALDNCQDLDPIRTKRHELAVAAATAILRATLDPAQSREQKLASVSVVLDTYLGYSPGCTYANGWCDAPEAAYKDPSGCACSLGASGGEGGLAALSCGLGLVLLALARRGALRQGVRAAATVTSALLVLAGPARADPGQPSTAAVPAPAAVTPRTQGATTTTTVVPAATPGVSPTVEQTVTTPRTTTTTVTSPTTPDPHGPPPPTLVPVEEPGPRDTTSMAFGGYLGGSASIEKASLAGAVGARLRVSKHWAFGLDGEWNPWVSYTGAAVRSGVFDLYGTVMLRFPLAYENFNLRICASAGTSYLLMNLYGAPSGSVGVYLGGSPLGIEWKLSRRFYLIINPLNIAVPVPQLRGIPLIYQEYRANIGLEIYAG